MSLPEPVKQDIRNYFSEFAVYPSMLTDFTHAQFNKGASALVPFRLGEVIEADVEFLKDNIRVSLAPEIVVENGPHLTVHRSGVGKRAGVFRFVTNFPYDAVSNVEIYTSGGRRVLAFPGDQYTVEWDNFDWPFPQFNKRKYYAETLTGGNYYIVGNLRRGNMHWMFKAPFSNIRDGQARAQLTR